MLVSCSEVAAVNSAFLCCSKNCMSLSRLGKLRFAHKVKISFSQLAPHSPLAAFLLSYADLSGQVCFK